MTGDAAIVKRQHMRRGLQHPHVLGAGHSAATVKTGSILFRMSALRWHLI